MKKMLSLLSLFVLLAIVLLSAPTALAQDKAVQMSEEFVNKGLAGYPLLDRTRILKGLMYAADLTSVPAEAQKAWTDFVKASLPAVVRDLSPSKDEETLEAAANILEIGHRYPAPGLEEKLAEWRRWALDPRFICPDSDIGRLGLALVLLHGRPDAAALKCAGTLLEAVIDGSRYENELHRFGIAPNGQALAHRLLHQVILAPIKTVHDRKLNWMLVTHYKYMTRKAAEAALALNVPVYYEPAPNLDERGKTNALSQGVGRKMGPLRDAYLATGDNKWGQAYKDIVMSQVRQFEDYGDFRCYYNLNVPGPWDGLNVVVTYTGAYDVLAPGGLLTQDEEDRIILMVREIGHELAWSLTYSNFVVHNMWGRCLV